MRLYQSSVTNPKQSHFLSLNRQNSFGHPDRIVWSSKDTFVVTRSFWISPSLVWFLLTHITHKRPFDHPDSLPETSSASRRRAAMLRLSQRWAVIFLRYVTSWVWELGSALHFKCVRNKLMYMSVDHPASVQIANLKRRLICCIFVAHHW